MQFVYSELFIHEENKIKLRLFEQSLWDERTDGRMHFWQDCTLVNGSTRTARGNLASLTHINDTVRWNTLCKVAILDLLRVIIRDFPDKTTANYGKPQYGQLMSRSRIEIDNSQIQILILKLNHFIKLLSGHSVFGEVMVCRLVKSKDKTNTCQLIWRNIPADLSLQHPLC